MIFTKHLYEWIGNYDLCNKLEFGEIITTYLLSKLVNKIECSDVVKELLLAGKLNINLHKSLLPSSLKVTYNLPKMPAIATRTENEINVERNLLLEKDLFILNNVLILDTQIYLVKPNKIILAVYKETIEWVWNDNMPQDDSEKVLLAVYNLNLLAHHIRQQGRHSLSLENEVKSQL